MAKHRLSEVFALSEVGPPKAPSRSGIKSGKLPDKFLKVAESDVFQIVQALHDSIRHMYPGYREKMQNVLTNVVKQAKTLFPETNWNDRLSQDDERQFDKDVAGNENG